MQIKIIEVFSVLFIFLINRIKHEFEIRIFSVLIQIHCNTSAYCIINKVSLIFRKSEFYNAYLLIYIPVAREGARIWGYSARPRAELGIQYVRYFNFVMVFKTSIVPIKLNVRIKNTYSLLI